MGRGSNLRDMLMIVRVTTVRGWWIVAIGGLLGAVVALGASATRPEVYRASAALYVTSNPDANSQSAYQGSLASEQRVMSYTQLVTTDAVVDGALARIDGTQMTRAQVKKAVSSSAKADTVLLNVSAETGSANDSVELANAIAGSMVQYVAKLETPPGATVPVAKLTLVTPARGAEQVSPQTAKNCLLGLFIGACLGICVSYVLTRLDSKITSASQIDSRSDMPPLLAVIGEGDASVDDVWSQSMCGSGALPEGFRRLRTNLVFTDVDKAIRSILVTSSMKGEGKTTTAVNLARSIAEAGDRCVIVDADLRSPAVAQRFSLNGDVGFTSILRGAAQVSDVIQESGVANLDVLTSGPIPPNPSELLGSARARSVLEELQREYVYVIIDSPPVLPVTDPAVVGRYVDAVIMVVRSGMTTWPMLLRAFSVLDVARLALSGVVLNGADHGRDDYGYGYGEQRLSVSD